MNNNIIWANQKSELLFPDIPEIPSLAVNIKI